MYNGLSSYEIHICITLLEKFLIVAQNKLVRRREAASSTLMPFYKDGIKMFPEIEEKKAQ
jgi:hypothetical protein